VEGGVGIRDGGGLHLKGGLSDLVVGALVRERVGWGD
jgi:hypothetical protein